MGKSIGLVVGLGNPESKYNQTRHNVGFWFVDALADEYGGSFRFQSKFSGDTAKVCIGGDDVWLLKPTTYMNLSGRSVNACAAYFRLNAERILVAHDELDLPAGTVRLKQGGGHGGHNGIRDVTQHVGKDFLRLRIGVGDPERPARGANFVLSAPPKAQREAIDSAITRAVAEIGPIIRGDVSAAMDVLHRV